MSQVNITLNTNTVDVNTTNNQIVVTDPTNPNVVNITQPVTSVVEVITAGPQGSPGPAGAIPNTGSFATTGSNTFIGNQTITGSVNTSGSLNVNNTLYVSGSSVGIGTSTPAYNLDVNGTARLGNLRLLNTSDTLEFANTLVRIVRESNKMRFDSFAGFQWNDTNAVATRMLIPSTGNVLINSTTDTGHKLLVTGSGTSGSLNIDGTLYVSGSRVGIGTSSPTGSLHIASPGATATDIAFKVRNSANTRDFLVVNGAGDVFNNGAGGVTTNTFFGENAGRLSVGISNSFFGNGAGAATNTGQSNSFFGLNSGLSNAGGNFNSFFGNLSGNSNTSGVSNSYFGRLAGQNNNGSNNTFIGSQSGRFTQDGVTSLTVAENSVFVGFDTRANGNSQTNQIVIGYQAIGLGSNSVVLGNDSITTTALKGNVGIKTTTPAATLDVSGSARITSGLTVTGSTVLTNGQTTVRGSGTTSGTTAFLIQNSTPATLLSVLDNGNVTVSGSNFDMFNNTAAYSGFTLNSNATSTMYVGAQSVYGQVKADVNGSNVWFGTTTGGAVTRLGHSGSAGGATYINFSTNGANTGLHVTHNGGSDLMTVTSVGNVGIGHPVPSASLHISGASSANLLRIDSPASSSILFVSGSGNVGIGTSAPLAPLDILVRRSASTQIAAFRTTATSGHISLYNFTDPQEIARIESSNDISNGGSLRLYTRNGSNVVGEKMRITGTGEVGIGTTTPTGKLSITDTIIASGSANSGSLLDLNQTWNTTGTPTAIKLNITNTASNVSSNLIDLQVGGLSRFKVRHDGALTTAEAISGNSFAISTDTINYSYSHFLSNRATTATSGTTSIFATFNSFSPTSGTATFIGTNISPTINQTGGANGITRGLYINPTITSASDFRAIETTNGRNIFTDTYTASGSANSGSLLDLRQTWNTTGNPTTLLLNVTNTASGVSSNLLDLQVGGASRVRIDKNGTIWFGSNNLALFAATGGSPAANGQTLFLQSSRTPTNGGDNYFFNPTLANNNTSGTANGINNATSFTPTSGTGIYNAYNFSSTINQTGGANGITRGLYIAPTLTAAADFRAIENAVGNNLLNSTSGNTYVGLSTNTGTARLQVRGSGATNSTTTFLVQNSTPTNLLSINDIGQVSFTSPTMSLAVSQSAFSISPIISASAVVGGQYYGVNITPTFFQTTGSQTETAFRVAATFTSSNATATGGTNIIADFGSTSAGSQLTVTDVTSGSIYMVNDVSGLPIIEATSDWGVKIYDFPRVVLEKTGSQVNINGTLQVSGSFILPLSQSATPQTGSAYWSGSLLFIYNGTRYMSASFF